MKEKGCRHRDPMVDKGA